MTEPTAICYGCIHCGCDPTDEHDYCRTCEECDDFDEEVSS